jgi:small subunit ribosomal protein S17
MTEQSTATERNGRKVREGLVVSDKMQSTVVVAVVERVRHARYGKTVQRTTRLYAHDAANDAKLGDRVCASRCWGARGAATPVSVTCSWPP